MAGKAGTTGKNKQDDEAVAGEGPPSCWTVAQGTLRGVLWLVQAVTSSLFILCVIRALNYPTSYQVCPRHSCTIN